MKEFETRLEMLWRHAYDHQPLLGHFFPRSDEIDAAKDINKARPFEAWTNKKLLLL